MSPDLAVLGSCAGHMQMLPDAERKTAVYGGLPNSLQSFPRVCEPSGCLKISWIWKSILTHWTEVGTGPRFSVVWKCRQAKCHIQGAPGSALGDEALSGELGRARNGIASPGKEW